MFGKRDCTRLHQDFRFGDCSCQRLRQFLFHGTSAKIGGSAICSVGFKAECSGCDVCQRDSSSILGA